MLFSSIVFLFCFLPIVVLGHTLLPQQWRNGWLLLCSLVFYAYGDARYLPLFLVLAAVNYGCALGIGRGGIAARVLTWVSVLANVLALVYYKYAGWLIPGLSAPSLPLGISFYVFQSLSYVLDVRAGRVQPEHSLIGYTTYIMLFPQLIAGPIVRYSDVAADLRSRKVDAAHLEHGMLLFMAGLASKVLLANQLGGLFDGLTALQSRGALGVIFGLLAYGFQLYYDFAGYSLMAVGMGEMLGFTFPHNFRHPFAATSIADFWRRWHITLGDWLRTYVYIPLGGSRKGTVRLVINLLITWGLSGIWHGAGFNFLLWGLYFGVLIALERLFYGRWLEQHKAAAHIYAFVAVLLSWLLFAFDTPEALAAFAGQFTQSVLGSGTLFLLQCSAVPLLLAIIFAVPFIGSRCHRAMQAHAVLRCAVMAVLFVLCVMELLGAQYNPFLYFRF